MGAFLDTASCINELIIGRVKQPVQSSLNLFPFFSRSALGKICFPKPIDSTASLSDHILLETPGHAECVVLCANIVITLNIRVADCLKEYLSLESESLFESVQAGNVIIWPELSPLMEVDLVLGQVSMVLVLVAQEEADASIKPWQTILRWVVCEAMANSINGAVEVRHPVLSKQFLGRKNYKEQIITI